jgi:hypothetical protein
MSFLKILQDPEKEKLFLLTIAWLVSRTITCFSSYKINTYVNLALFDIVMLIETKVTVLYQLKIFFNTTVFQPFFLEKGI